MKYIKTFLFILLVLSLVFVFSNKTYLFASANDSYTCSAIVSQAELGGSNPIPYTSNSQLVTTIIFSRGSTTTATCNGQPLSAQIDTYNCTLSQLAYSASRFSTQVYCPKPALQGVIDNPVGGNSPFSTTGGIVPFILVIMLPLIYGLVGVIVFGLISYAGFLLMVSNGDTNKVAKAKSVLTGAIIGASIILLAYIISLILVHTL